MKQSINFYDFQKAFQELRPNSFTYDHNDYSEQNIEDHLATTSYSGSLIFHAH